jgi:hypothetical protein
MMRIMSVLCAATITASVAASAVQFRDAPRAGACTGGMTFGFAVVHARAIIVGEAVAVGDEVNRAPTLTPTSTPTISPTSTPTPIFPRSTMAGTQAAPPAPPPAQGVPRTPPGFSLQGYGVVIHAEHIYGGSADILDKRGNVEIDGDVRASIERDLRQLESGRGLIGTCSVGAFVPKFDLGERYLIIADDRSYPNLGLWTGYRLRLEGDYAILNDPEYGRFGNQFPIELTANQYHRRFEGTSADVRDDADWAEIAADRVPLSSVLQLASEVAGRPFIAPPETGTAGLLPQP